MSSQQICQLLLQTPLKRLQTKRKGSLQVHTSYELQTDQDYVIQKLHQIANSLNEQKIKFSSILKKQQETIIQNIHKQKDQIIQDLLKNIHNLKRQNEQLKFQYRKRFQVIKNVEDKYQQLIQDKNKKISELQSIIKYLERNIKGNQKKISKLQHQIVNTTGVLPYFNKNQNYRSLNKMNAIVSKAKNKQFVPERLFSRNSLQDLTVPIKSSFISRSKVSSSSRTIARNRQNQIKSPGQSDIFSSFLATSQHMTDNNFDTQTIYAQASRIKPICLQTNFNTAKYLTLQDFSDIRSNQSSHLENIMRRSQQVKASQMCVLPNRFNNKN